jgi:hypothetical protein
LGYVAIPNQTDLKPRDEQKIWSEVKESGARPGYIFYLTLVQLPEEAAVQQLRRAGSERCEAAEKSAGAAVTHDCYFKAKESLLSVYCIEASPVVILHEKSACAGALGSKHQTPQENVACYCLE